MDDLISRQAAIEVIDAVFPVDPMKSEYAQGIACGAALAKTYVEQLPSAQQWIPCSERMPEKDGTYFVSGVWENGDAEVGQLQYIADEHRFSNVIYFNALAWMPLPSPYREEVSG